MEGEGGEGEFAQFYPQIWGYRSPCVYIIYREARLLEFVDFRLRNQKLLNFVLECWIC